MNTAFCRYPLQPGQAPCAQPWHCQGCPPAAESCRYPLQPGQPPCAAPWQCQGCPRPASSPWSEMLERISDRLDLAYDLLRDLLRLR